MPGNHCTRRYGGHAPAQKSMHNNYGMPALALPELDGKKLPACFTRLSERSFREKSKWWAICRLRSKPLWTGSIAFGRDREGKTARAGGWGFAISDEGSGHWVGRAAVAALLQAADESSGGPQVQPVSPLFREMQSVWKVETLAQLARTANSTPDFAALFPAVLAACDQKDELAPPILREAAAELARLAGRVVRRLFPDPHGTVPMAMSGGVFRYSAMIRELFYNQIQAAYSQVVLNPDVVEPVHGAWQMARRAAL
jgi:glucosamine kinase